MSLLWMDYEAEFRNLVDNAFECEREDQQVYFSTLNDRVVKIIYRDTKYKFDKDTKKTIFIVRQFVDSGLSLNDIYVDILAESMRRIGELWHTGKITVDIEHYCTSVTQTAMPEDALIDAIEMNMPVDILKLDRHFLISDLSDQCHVGINIKDLNEGVVLVRQNELSETELAELKTLLTENLKTENL